MKIAPFENLLRDEDERLAALADLAILDTPLEAEFDELTSLAASILEVESAAISLVDHDRQWFKSRVNLPMAETPRDVAFCHHTVEKRDILLVPDATRDPRFKNNPLVTADGGIKFYAGAPLFQENGFCVGSLCVIDSSPRHDFDERCQEILRSLANVAARLMSARRDRLRSEIAAKVVHETTDAIVAADSSGKIVLLNPAAEGMFGYPAENALGQNIELLMPADSQPCLPEKDDDAAVGDQTHGPNSFVALSVKTADGSEVETEVSQAPWGDSDGDGGFAAIFRDISDRKALEADRQKARNLIDKIMDNIPAMLFVKDAQTREYLMVNKMCCEVAGIREEDFYGKTDSQLFGPSAPKFERQDEETVGQDDAKVFNDTFTRADGRTFHVRTTRVMMDGPDRKHQYILGLVEDTTDIRASEAENVRLAHFDGLTGLRNRTSLNLVLEDYVSEGIPFALLSVDLDRFKSVNEQFGHHAGDAVLVEAGLRLQKLAEPRGTLARIGGDEFVLLLKGDRLSARSVELADKIIEAMAEPFETGDQVAHIGASVGIAMHPDDAETAEKMRENVYLALYRAKREGRGKACLFDTTKDAAVRDRRTLEGDLRRAIAGGEIKLAYQPVVSVGTTRVSSVEALARWEHPTRGFVNPETFIALAEDCGLIDELGCRLLNMACDDAMSWPEDLRVAVNLSPLQFRSGQLVNTIKSALDRSGLKPGRLQLEVTERLVIEDTDETVAQLKQLRELGIQILIDDFGVGHSSLSYFQVLPFDKVKIDKSFIAEVETCSVAKAIVEAVISLTRQLSMGVVAEGVETERQRKLLSDLGCTHLQGYHFSKAIPPEEVAAFVATLQAPAANANSTAGARAA